MLAVSVYACVCLNIGNPLGVSEVNPDVLGLISHATQERLRDLLEKLTVIAHHHNISYRVCVISLSHFLSHAHNPKHLTLIILGT